MTFYDANPAADPTEQIQQRRAMRRRRQRYWIPLDTLALLAFLASVIWLDDPLDSLIIVLYAAVSAGGPLILEGADTWQRQRVILRFALGAACSAVWMMVAATRQLLDSNYQGTSTTALTVLGLVWLQGTLVDRWRDSSPA